MSNERRRTTSPAFWQAVRWAMRLHATQVRKYTGAPYATHLLQVAKLVRDHGGLESQMIAAVLHDAIEDQGVTRARIELDFGPWVAELVEWLTDISHPSDGNRAKRKAMDRAHIGRAPAEAALIKLADLIDNTRTIVQYDPDFAVVYLAEKRRLLEVLYHHRPQHRALHAKAVNQLAAALETLKEKRP